MWATDVQASCTARLPCDAHRASLGGKHQQADENQAPEILAIGGQPLNGQGEHARFQAQETIETAGPRGACPSEQTRHYSEPRPPSAADAAMRRTIRRA